ncbi:MAG: GNAT family N-acetyltransferase [Chloroflexota bacterium]|nr:GNAT family N-acetyltransferase [Chloroflexota bacterium]
MTVTLRPITSENWVRCIELTPTPEQQARGFVAPNVLSLAQAYAEPWWIPYAIYADDTMVGLVMYGRWPESGIPAHHGAPEAGIDYVLRMMIDHRYQGRGYGRAAMELLITRIAAQPSSHAIELDYDEDNEAAARLYTGLGFRPVRQMPDGAILARLVLPDT